MDAVTVNGSTIDRVYVDNTLVYENSVTLQLPSSGQAINLKDFIDANAGGKEKVLLESNGILGGIESGNLAGLDVTLTINGESQGIRSDTRGEGGHALVLTSPVKLYLNGALRGAGGGGGTGAKGADDVYTTQEWSESYDAGSNLTMWRRRKSVDYHDIFKDDVRIGGGQPWSFDGPTTISGKTYKRGSDQAYAGDYASLLTEYTQTHDRTGGAGGTGGLGRGYDKSATSGSTGSPSTPSGGNTGGTGGSGGDWGDAGVRPIGGSSGALAGNAISGQSFIQNNDWNNGQVDGLVT